MNRNGSGLWAAVVGTAILLVSARAWAPPLCAGRTIVEHEVLTLQVRAVTIDGTPQSVPAATPYPLHLQSGCELQSLDGAMFDPDNPQVFRSVFWGLETP